MTDLSPLVLVVDDVQENRSLMRAILERGHFRVLEAATGADALRTVEADHPDIVVLDLGMSGMSGLEVARTVRLNSDPDVAQTPLLACSASVQPEVRAEALAAGCDDFIGKPFDVRFFVSQVTEVIARQGGR